MSRTCPERWSLGLLLLMVLPRFGACGQETHWSYRPIVRPEIPTNSATASSNPIDRFVWRHGGKPPSRFRAAPYRPAEPRTLIRRVTLDLIGVPPTPVEIQSFVADDRPDAYLRLVDRLLASPHYGEHWARGWLDLCHYADSDGYLTDQPRPVAWRYRQWLVDALNQGVPFDQFTIEQLSGDLIPGSTIDQKLATGFLRQTLSNREGGADPAEFRVKQVVDRTTMVGEIWMGLTVGCAQCHDHKYDDISQAEFFQLYAFLDSADEINIDAPLPAEQQSTGEPNLSPAVWSQYQAQRRQRIGSRATEIEAAQQRWEQKILYARDHPGEDWFWDRQWELLGLVWGGGQGEGQLEGWQIVMLDRSRRSQLQRDRLLDYYLSVAAVVDAETAQELKLSELSAALNRLKSTLPQVTRAPVMMQTQTPRLTHIQYGGDFRDLGDQVTPATPAVLPTLDRPGNDRLALARWLTAPDHPLTARVAVNRMWQEFFGRGIVATAGDFGVRGEPPDDPELLDYLASEFLRRQWDVKAMHRLMVTSKWYRRRDAPALRLSAEQIRDSILSASGLWDARVGGPSVRPPQPDSVSEQGYGNTWETSSGGDRYRRGLYTWIQRTSPFAMHITFDAPNPNHICTRRERSNTPLQALTLLNDPMVYDAAWQLAAQLIKHTELDDRARIRCAFRQCLSRDPAESEISVLLELLSQLRHQQAKARLPSGDQPSESHKSSLPTNDEKRIWATLCTTLFNLHEFVTRP